MVANLFLGAGIGWRLFCCGRRFDRRGDEISRGINWKEE